MTDKVKRSLFILGVVLLIGVAFIPLSCSIVGPSERGVAIKLGQIISEDPIQPGIVWHAPFITKIKKFSVVPRTYEVTFSCDSDGAITKDMQTVGATVVVRYNYDETRIVEIVENYRDSKVIENAMKDCVKASLKETTGKYSIYDLVAEQAAITKEVARTVLDRMNENYPILVNNTTITNWDWDEGFDKMIKETANRTQQIKQAEAEANIVEAQAQKKVKEAEARKQVAEYDADAAETKAQGEANALLIKARAEAEALKLKSQNISMYKLERDFDIKEAAAKQWDGVVPHNYIPLTASGGIVQLK